MRYLKIDKIIPGIKLGRDLLDENDRILLRKGTILTETVLKLLERKSIQYLFVDDELTSDIEIEEVIPQTLRNNIIKSLKNLNIENTIEHAREMVQKVLDAKNISIDIYDDSANSHDIYEHSLAVTELSICLGRLNGYNQEKLSDLAVSALLHDMGKLFMDQKNSKVFDMDKMFKKLGINVSIEEYREQMHSLYGFNLLWDNILVKATVKQGVLAHHENIDGTGPLGLTGDKIFEYAKIIHIANSFVHLLNNTHGAEINNTSEIAEYMIANSGKKYDKDLVNLFINNVPIYPPGLTIELSNGMKAVVHETNAGHPTRPKILLEGAGRPIDLLDPRLYSITVLGVWRDNQNSLEEQEKSK